MATIEEAKTAIVSTAQRMARSIAYSREHLTGAALETAASILTMANQWALCILFAGWVVGTVVSGPIGIAAKRIIHFSPTVWIFLLLATDTPSG